MASPGLAHVVSPGEIEIAPKTLLNPDLLVVPASYPPGTKWTAMQGWWLAVEVLGPGSRIYDRDFKRDAYLALGVEEVWLVDLREQELLVSRATAPRDVPHRSVLRWHPSALSAPLEINLSSIFAGL